MQQTDMREQPVKLACVLQQSGPGATNLVTGIATAYMDSIPIVAITCNVGVSLLGKDSFQEIDITGITLPITKHNFIVKDVKRSGRNDPPVRLPLQRAAVRVRFWWILPRMRLQIRQSILRRAGM